MLIYTNKGHVQGVLARDPYKVAEGVVVITIRVMDDRINPKTRRRDFHFPSFVIFGKESDKAVANLVKGQEVAVDYKLETRSKDINGERKYFEDNVVLRIIYGRRPDGAKPAPVKEDTPVEAVFETLDESHEDEDAPMEDN